MNFKSFIRGLNLIAVLVVMAFAIEHFLVPHAADWFYRDRYKELMFQCDNVMRDHFIAKQMVSIEPSLQAIRNLEASEVGLLSCHDYDKLRKKLLLLGLSPDRLSLIGLEAIEERARDLRTFVETHEIRY